MLIHFSPLLINFLIIFLCIFYYEIFWVNHLEKSKNRPLKNRLLIAVLCFIAIFLVMYFPFTLSPGNIFDLRKIPLIIGILYGGYEVGFLLTAVMVAYRFYLGGIGAYNTLIVYSILYAVACLILPFFKRMPQKRKMVAASALAAISSLPGPFFDFFQGASIGREEIYFYVFYLFLNTATMASAIYIIERMNSNFQLRQEIIKNEQMKVLSQLAASVAHEIRNPLTTSRGFMQLIQSDSHPNTNRYAGLAISEMDRAHEIINDYLSFARPDIKKEESISLEDLLNQSLNIIRPYAHFNHVEIVENMEDNLSIWGDRKGLTQCLINLLKNSVEAMPNGGKIFLHAKGKGQRVEVTIVDTGVGMSKEQMERLGTPFYSTKEKGTGLGLMVTYSIIKSLQGHINVESKTNEGTAFTISLPKGKPLIPRT